MPNFNKTAQGDMSLGSHLQNAENEPRIIFLHRFPQ